MLSIITITTIIKSTIVYYSNKTVIVIVMFERQQASKLKNKQGQWSHPSLPSNLRKNNIEGWLPCVR
jgi:hypothetical protein